MSKLDTLQAALESVLGGQIVALKRELGEITGHEAGAKQAEDRFEQRVEQVKQAIALPPHRIAHLGVGYCPEERGIYSSLTAEENLLLAPLPQSDVV